MAATIPLTRTTTPRPRPPVDQLGFGKHFSDHQFVVDYTEGRGWHDARVVPYGPLVLDPAAAVLHYAQALFDGLKAFRGVDGKVRVFRLDRHVARMAAGAERLCFPAVDTELLREGILAAIRADLDWVPGAPGTALYIRPTLIATEPFLGVRPAHRYVLFVITSPVGAYYASGFDPVKIWVERREVRAAEGGLGAVKAAANYAASLHAAESAKKKGYAQVLWLDAREHKYLEEVGTMNLFLHIGDELITPPLDGTILGGVTRASVIELARAWGLRVTERRIAIDEVRAAAAAGALREVFGSGTAAVISPVGELGVDDTRLVIGDGGTGPLAQRLYEAITAIQYGRAADPHGWTTVVE